MLLPGHRASFAPAVLIAATLLVSLAASAPANAKTCKSWGFVGQAYASTKAQGLVLARADWIVKVTDYWGVAWRNYNIASGKWEYCETGGGPRRLLLCRAAATPCKN